MIDRLLGRAGLKERIEELEEEKRHLERRAEAEEQRRSDAVADRQRAEERVNELEHRIGSSRWRSASTAPKARRNRSSFGASAIFTIHDWPMHSGVSAPSRATTPKGFSPPSFRTTTRYRRASRSGSATEPVSSDEPLPQSSSPTTPAP